MRFGLCCLPFLETFLILEMRQFVIQPTAWYVEPEFWFVVFNSEYSRWQRDLGVKRWKDISFNLAVCLG
jgi:hypothetical protein